jgi:phage terminase large subunit GpA-like protein
MSDPFTDGLSAGLKPQERMDLSEWAEARMVIPAERASAPGPYRVGDAIYQRGMMNAATNPANEVVVFVTSSQVGKTTILTAAQGYFAEAAPSPQLSIWPTQIVADNYISETFDPTVRASPALATIFKNKTYPGGYIAFVGANNPSQLAARPIRVVTGDEVDRWNVSSGKEGSPIVLAERRQTTFFNRISLFASTPLREGASQIIDLFKACKQHYFFVKCPECSTKQVLNFDNVTYVKGREHEAQYGCNKCGVCWDEWLKRRLVREGEWLEVDGKHAPYKCFKTDDVPKTGNVGYWINALYSPWSSLAKIAKEWSDSEGNPEKEQTFFNTTLGLPWEGDISSYADPDSLMKRLERYDPMVCPRGAGCITTGVDVQDDRIEVLPVAWGSGDECWLLKTIVIPIAPTLPQAWIELAEVLMRKFKHPSGYEVTQESVAVDSGDGGNTQRVYDFANKWMRVGKRWQAVKGVPGERKLVWQKSDMRFKDATKLFLVAVDDAKTTIYTRYGIMKPGPGFVHLYGDSKLDAKDGLTEAQVKQLTAERAEVEYVNGFPKRTWTKPKGRRNEMLDMFVYAYAARCSLTIDIDARLAAMNDVAPVKALTAADVGKMFK